MNADEKGADPPGPTPSRCENIYRDGNAIQAERDQTVRPET